MFRLGPAELVDDELLLPYYASPRAWLLSMYSSSDVAAADIALSPGGAGGCGA
jgi:hypothetical protein